MLKVAAKNTVAAGKSVSPDVIMGLIADLGSQDGLVRVKARRSLINVGHTAVKPLVRALSSKKKWVRWEVTKTLSQIADPLATKILIDAFEDKLFDVRWLAAEGLSHIGHEALVPLLQVLIQKGASLSVQEGVHHALHGIEGGHKNPIIAPVLNALEGGEPSLEAPLAAQKALVAVRNAEKQGRLP